MFNEHFCHWGFCLFLFLWVLSDQEHTIHFIYKGIFHNFFYHRIRLFPCWIYSVIWITHISRQWYGNCKFILRWAAESSALFQFNCLQKEYRRVKIIFFLMILKREFTEFSCFAILANCPGVIVKWIDEKKRKLRFLLGMVHRREKNVGIIPFISIFFTFSFFPLSFSLKSTNNSQKLHYGNCKRNYFQWERKKMREKSTRQKYHFFHISLALRVLFHLKYLFATICWIFLHQCGNVETFAFKYSTIIQNLYWLGNICCF